MSANRKSWRWCRKCRQWVFEYPFAVGCFCDGCERAELQESAQAAAVGQSADYIERDYMAAAMI